MKNRLKNKSNNTPQNKEKQSGHEELGEGISEITKWTCYALLNTLAATGELTRAGVSKIAEKIGNKNPDVQSNRKELAEHHFGQAKRAGKAALRGIGNTINGGYHTIKGTTRTVFGSVKNSIKDTVNGLREDQSENKQENEQQNQKD